MASNSFHYCKDLHQLLSCQQCENCCSSCNQQTTYFASDGMSRKHIPRKPRESKHTSSKNVLFQINVQARTGKHKRAKAHTWNADSGATVSVTNDISLFQTITDFAPSQRVCVANKQLVQVTCIGTVLLTLLDEKQKPYEMLLDNVMY